MFDMMALACDTTGFLHLKGPKGNLLYKGDEKDGQKVGITLYSPASEEFAQAEADEQNEISELVRVAGGKLELTPAQRFDRRVRMYAKITKSFDNWDYSPDPKKTLTGREMFEAAYRDRSIGFIVHQVETKHGDWSIFMKGSATS